MMVLTTPSAAAFVSDTGREFLPEDVPSLGKSGGVTRSPTDSLTFDPGPTITTIACPGIQTDAAVVACLGDGNEGAALVVTAARCFGADTLQIVVQNLQGSPIGPASLNVNAVFENP